MSPMAMAIKASKNLQKTEERKRKGKKKKKRRESDATTIQNCYFRLKSGSPG